jgi:hypothetical protein
VYRHASTTWDEPSLEERERVMGFQTGIISHTKVTRLVFVSFSHCKLYSLQMSLQFFGIMNGIDKKYFNFINCRNPTLAKCGGEAQHLEKLEVWSPLGLPNV